MISDTLSDDLDSQEKPEIALSNSSSVDYASDVLQVNGCRMYGNPPTGWLLPAPTTTELFIKNIPRNFLENDILPHFDRFGQIYSFRLLMDYDHLNRGYGYLKYSNDKSTLIALDTMNYYIPKTATMLEIQKSYEKSDLFVTNIPAQVDNSIIREVLRSLFPELSNIHIKRPKEKYENGVLVQKNVCSALIEFLDHDAALRAKQMSSTGALNLWNRTIKVLWARSEAKVNHTISKYLVIHNMPDLGDTDVLFHDMTNFVFEHEILSISPLHKFWLLEFSNIEAASTILDVYKKRQMPIEWATRKHYTCKVDTDAELRLQCVANYWEMPVFIYGRVVRSKAIQTVAVMIKNQRKNLFTVFFIEIVYDKLIEIHSRVCEIVMKCITIFGNLPKNNVVLKCCDDKVFIVGCIMDLECPILTPPTLMQFEEQVTIYLAEVYDLAAMCFKLCVLPLDDMFLEYQDIIKKKFIHHQFITNVISNNRILGCIDPKYRKCKRLKIGLSHRQVIFVLCDVFSKNNVDINNIFPPQPVKIQYLYTGQFRTIGLRQTLFHLMDNSRMQTIDLHNCYRNHIEYGAGCDYWCMPVNQGDQGDQEKTPTPMKMNVNMGTKDFYQQALNSQVDQLFFGSMPPSSDQTPSPCTVTGTSKCSRFIFGHDEIN